MGMTRVLSGILWSRPTLNQQVVAPPEPAP